MEAPGRLVVPSHHRAPGRQAGADGLVGLHDRDDDVDDVRVELLARARPSSAIAASRDIALRYGRSVVIALKASQAAMTARPDRDLLAARPSG